VHDRTAHPAARAETSEAAARRRPARDRSSNDIAKARQNHSPALIGPEHPARTRRQTRKSPLLTQQSPRTHPAVTGRSGKEIRDGVHRAPPPPIVDID
ncbi:hypothetical protein ACFQ07_04995, partial [Actinomadura adrarensis]